jgi:hypothetical protein
MSGDLESNLQDYELKKEEWVIIEQLAEVLKVCVRIACLTACCDGVQIYKHATLFFSCGTPNLTSVIPAMDHINDFLTEQTINNVALLPSIRAACTLSKKTLNCYYDKTNASETYRIAMSMCVLCSSFPFIE